MLSGDNSILSRATQARERTEFAKVKEEIALAQAEAVGNHYLGGSSDTIEAQVLAKLTAAGYTIGSENSGTIQDISLSSNSVTIEEGGNTAEVTATLNTSGGSTNYVLINGLYYPLTTTNGDIELGETGKAELTDSAVTLSDVTLAETGSINATLDSSTGKVTITSSNVTADENAIVKLQNNGTDYATINVAVKKASISIPATADVTSGGTTTISATLATYQTGTISWSITSGSSYASIPANSTGTSVVVTGGTTTGQTATIRATYTTGTASVTTTADCEVTVKADNHISDKSYVDYNVAYTDVYTGTPYTSDTGWRLLTDLSSYESAGTYTGNIEIISTGIPAKLYYSSGSITSFENTSPKTTGYWAGDSSQRTTYRDSYYSYNDSTSNKNIYAASGLMYNFENIVFNYSGTIDNLTTTNISAEYGGYVAISNGGTAVTANNATTGASLFRVSSLASGTIPEGGIRSVSLADLTGGTGSDTSFTDKRTGLFTLQNYTPDTYSSGYYWLASPRPGDSSSLRRVDSNGGINYGNGIAFGVRPVVSITGVTLRLNGNVWQIVANSNN